MIIDHNGTGFIRMVLGITNCFYFSNFTIDELGRSFVMWRNKIRVKDMAAEENNIPDHNRSEKLKKSLFLKPAC